MMIHQVINAYKFSAVSKRYWRLRFPSGSAHATFLGLSEIEFHATVGSSDLSSSAGASASSSDAGFAASRAFDNNGAQSWFCDDNLQSGSWIACDLGSNQDLEEIIVTGDGTNTQFGPLEIVVDYSPDGTNWTNDTRWPTMTSLLWDITTDGGETKKIRRTDTGLPIINVAPFNMNLDNGGWTNFTLRQPLPAAVIPGQGCTKLRFSFQSGATEGLVVNKCYIQKLNSTYGFTTTPVQVTFNGGSTSFTIAAGATQTSDDVTLTLSSTDAACVSLFIPSGQSANDTFKARTYSGVGLATYFKSGDDASNTSPASYSTVSARNLFLASLETW